MIPVDPIILSITEHKMRMKLDEFYVVALDLRDCAQVSSHIGNPATKEGVSSYTQYIELMDNLYKYYNDVTDYFSLIGAYKHNQIYEGEN